MKNCSRRVVILLALLAIQGGSGMRNKSAERMGRLSGLQLEKNYCRFIYSRLGYSRGNVDWVAIAQAGEPESKRKQRQG